MKSRFLAPVGIALLLSLSLWSAGLAQRVGQQTQTRSYSVVLQVAPASPVLVPQPAPPPVEEIPVPQEIIEPDQDAMEAFTEEDLEEMGWSEEAIDLTDEEMDALWPADEEPMLLDQTAVVPGGEPAPAPVLVSTMPMDQGRVANNRLQINIADPVLGVLRANETPAITITIRDRTTQEIRILSNVTPTNDVTSVPTEWRFGNNLYLSPGSYAITVDVNGERANFPYVVVPSRET